MCEMCVSVCIPNGSKIANVYVCVNGCLAVFFPSRSLVASIQIFFLSTTWHMLWFGGQATVSPQGNRQALLCQCTQTISQSDLCQEGGERCEEKRESDRYALFESNGSEGEREIPNNGCKKLNLLGEQVEAPRTPPSSFMLTTTRPCAVHMSVYATTTQRLRGKERER